MYASRSSAVKGAEPACVRPRRQLGISLHALGSRLPLYDGVTGAPISEATDARVERVTQRLTSCVICVVAVHVSAEGPLDLEH